MTQPSTIPAIAPAVCVCVCVCVVEMIWLLKFLVGIVCQVFSQAKSIHAISKKRAGKKERAAAETQCTWIASAPHNLERWGSGQSWPRCGCATTHIRLHNHTCERPCTHSRAPDASAPHSLPRWGLGQSSSGFGGAGSAVTEGPV